MDEITNSILDDSDRQGKIDQAQIGVMGIRNDADPNDQITVMRIRDTRPQTDQSGSEAGHNGDYRTESRGDMEGAERQGVIAYIS
jgi:hypothetical protein